MLRSRILLIGLLAGSSLPTLAQTAVLPIYACTLPGVQAKTSGLNSSNYLQGIIPSCTVTVYLTGTTTLATTTPQSPFTANTNGSIPPIYAAINQGYDVVLSGGIAPNTYPAPRTITGLYPGQSITSCGAITPCTIPEGGTGATTAAGALVNLGTEQIAQGGTGATTAAGARAALAVLGIASNLSDVALPSSALNNLEAWLPVVNCPVGDTIAQCVAMLPSTGGVVQLAAASYVSGYSSSYLNIPNVAIVGTNEPIVSADGSHLQGGSIIQGKFGHKANNFYMANVGVDVGPALHTAGVLDTSDGLLATGATGDSTHNPADPTIYGDTLVNVIVLGASNTQHDISNEHENGVNYTNVTAVGGQSHCYATKSSNQIVNGFRAIGCGTDGIGTYADGYTVTVSNVNWANGVVDNTGTQGIGMIAEEEAGPGTISYVSYNNIQVLTDSPASSAYGRCALINNSSSGGIGAGAVNHITFDGINCNMQGSQNRAGFVSAGSFSSDVITIKNTTIVNANAPMTFQQLLTNSVFSDITSYNSTYFTEIEGTGNVVHVWSDLGPSAPTIPTFENTLSGSVLNVDGYFSNRGNQPFVASGGAVINALPNQLAMNSIAGTVGADVQFNGNVYALGSFFARNALSGGTYAGAHNTGTGSAALQAIADGSNYASTYYGGLNRNWSTGMYGDSMFRIQDNTAGAVYPVRIEAGSPLDSIYIYSSGQIRMEYLSTGTAGYVCVTTTGQLYMKSTCP